MHQLRIVLSAVATTTVGREFDYKEPSKYLGYSKCSKISNTFQNVVRKLNMFSGLEFTKCFAEYQTGKTLIRLLLQKQSDLGLCCLSRIFRHATSV